MQRQLSNRGFNRAVVQRTLVPRSTLLLGLLLGTNIVALRTGAAQPLDLQLALPPRGINPVLSHLT